MKNSRTIKRQVTDASIEPEDTQGKVHLYDPEKVLPVLYDTGTTDGSLDLQQERAMLAKKQAGKTAIQVDQLRGTLVDAAEVEAVWIEYVAACRAKLLALPTKVASEVMVAETLPEVQEIIKRHIYEALEEL